MSFKKLSLLVVICFLAGFSCPVLAQVTVVEFSEGYPGGHILLDGTSHFDSFGISFEDETYWATDSRFVGAGDDAIGITTTSGSNSIMTVVFDPPVTSVSAFWLTISSQEISATAYSPGGVEIGDQSQQTGGGNTYGVFDFNSIGSIGKITISDGTGAIGVGRLEMDAQPLTPVPAMTPIGLAVLIMLLATAGIILLRRKRHTI
jgi:hypothetical protein